jgi:hypothetical protein
MNFDSGQRRQLAENLKKAQRDLTETVWRSYKNLSLLGKDNVIKTVDLGLVHSSAAANLAAFILERLRKDGEIEKDISPNFLVRNWPPAFKEWSVKAVRDASFSSPQFPKLLDGESVRETISRGVSGGLLAYVGKSSVGAYEPFVYGSELGASEVEVKEDTFIVTKETAETYKRAKEKPPVLATLLISPQQPCIEPGKKQTFTVKGQDQYGSEIATGEITGKATGGGGTIAKDGVFTAGQDEGNFIMEVTADRASGSTTLSVAKEGSLTPPPTTPFTRPGMMRWTGEIPPQKWMNFYTKVLSRFASSKGLKLTVSVQVSPEGDISKQKVEETKTALRELGLDDDIKTT